MKPFCHARVLVPSYDLSSVVGGQHVDLRVCAVEGQFASSDRTSRHPRIATIGAWSSSVGIGRISIAAKTYGTTHPPARPFDTPVYAS